VLRKSGQVVCNLGLRSPRLCETIVLVDELDGTPGIGGVETVEVIFDGDRAAPLPGSFEFVQQCRRIHETGRLDNSVGETEP
jgi:hypothetical protein